MLSTRHRFSVYGWFLAPGQLYQLEKMETGDEKGREITNKQDETQIKGIRDAIMVGDAIVSTQKGWIVTPI